MIRKVLLPVIFSILVVAGCVDECSAENGRIIDTTEKRGRMAYSGFSGGMRVHSGWLSAGTITIDAPGGSYTQRMEGLPTGIGGAAKLCFGDHLRVGCEGYVTTLKYGGTGSYASVGWGGVLADCIWELKGWAPFGGVTVGGGRVKNLTLAAKPSGDFTAEQGASYRNYGFAAVTPFAGVEIPVGPVLRIVLKVDWLLNVSNPQPDYPSGPRIYVGFSFCRSRK